MVVGPYNAGARYQAYASSSARCLDEGSVIRRRRLDLPISNVHEVNILGNVWEITEVEDGNSVRLAGGSLFCSENTCHGTVKERELFVDKETGNSNVGFCVIN